MRDLLKAEYYKLWRLKSFWGLMALSVLVGSLLSLDHGLPVSAAGCFLATLYSIPMLYPAPIIFGALFLGEEFDNRTLNACVCAGKGRGQILLAKALAFLTACVLLTAAPLLAVFLAGLAVWGMPEARTGANQGTPSELLPGTPSELLLDTPSGPLPAAGPVTEGLVILTAVCAMGMLVFLFAFLFRDVGKTLAVPLVSYFLMIFLLNGSLYNILSVLLPMAQLRLIALRQLTAPPAFMLAVNIFWTVLCYGGAYAVFRRCELK